MSRSRSSVVALRHRNFRLLWVGLLVSFTGTSMRNAALLWHVSLLVSPESKALALGAVGLVRVSPFRCSAASSPMRGIDDSVHPGKHLT